jgi:ABC-type ATPase involved in cell division
MEINRVRVRNFKRIVDAQIDLKGITYLVGGNNAGKSSILQAIHMAISCAQISAELQQQVIAEASLKYSPAADFVTLGNAGPYENRKDGSRGRIDFTGKTDDDADASYSIEIYKARNHHNVGVDRSGVSIGFGQHLNDPKTLFSVYVPGLAGVPHKEEMLSYASVFHKAAGGEANLVFRNIIRLIHRDGKIADLQAGLLPIIGPVRFQIEYDENKDLRVSVKISHGEDAPFVPLDLCGTGVVQVTQILAYAILFKPKLLLIDEPDSHLHPSKQSLLARAFEEISRTRNCKIIVSTHSRHLISAAGVESALVWLRDGQVETQENRDLTEILLDIGALDQLNSDGAEIIICTEDKGKGPLEACLAASGYSERCKVISFSGISNAGAAVAIHQMAQLLPNEPRVVIHRDRDFLTDEEIHKWSTEYRNRNIDVFCPSLCDVEAYFVDAEHLAQIYGVPAETATNWRSALIEQNAATLRRKFREKRVDAIRKYWPEGGGPAVNNLWPEGTLPTEVNVYGKELLRKANDDAQERFGRRRNVYERHAARLQQELVAFLQLD